MDPHASQWPPARAAKAPAATGNNVTISQVQQEMSSHVRLQGCPEVFPLLTGTPWWDSAAFDWVEKVEGSCGIIREELLGLRGVKGGFRCDRYRVIDYNWNLVLILHRPFRQPSWAGGGGAGRDAGQIHYHFSASIQSCKNNITQGAARVTTVAIGTCATCRCWPPTRAVMCDHDVAILCCNIAPNCWNAI